MAEVLDDGAVQAGLDELDGWAVRDGALHRAFDRGDFAGAMAFVNAVAEIAEHVDHHPDIAISWKDVDLAIASHSAGGITAQCLDLARRIDAIA